MRGYIVYIRWDKYGQRFYNEKLFHILIDYMQYLCDVPHKVWIHTSMDTKQVWYFQNFNKEDIRVNPLKYLKLGVMGPSFLETGDEMITQDENSSQELRMRPNQLSRLNWWSYEFNPSFEFALPVCIHCLYSLWNGSPCEEKKNHANHLNWYPVSWNSTLFHSFFN
jgi:hypothetical protein